MTVIPAKHGEFTKDFIVSDREREREAFSRGKRNTKLAHHNHIHNTLSPILYCYTILSLVAKKDESSGEILIT